MSEVLKSSIRTVNPATGKEEKVFDVMSDAQINQIIEKAHTTFQSWRNTPIKERVNIINRVASVMRERKEELAKIATKEMGKLLSESIGEVDICISIFEYYAKNAEKFLADEKLETPLGSAFIRYEPVGVVLSIQPWNFPYYQITRSAAPNIIAGNTMVLKHASNVPQCAQIVEDIFHQAGLPQGVYTNLFVPGSKTSQLIQDPRIKAVAFTGSEPAGSSVAATAGKNIKKSTLELGGSDPLIILDDADIEKSVRAAVEGRLWNAGQVCISPKRIIVHQAIAEEFTQKVIEQIKQIRVGDPMDPQTQLAPLSSEKALEEVLQQVQETVAQGAKLVHGGRKIERPGAFMEPTILTNIQKGMLAYHQEIFGPVLCIYVVKDEQEAIELANDSEFGLGGSIFSSNEERAVKVARQIETGMVYINHITGVAAELPFGGTKKSGFGREHYKLGIHEFVNQKLIRISNPENIY